MEIDEEIIQLKTAQNLLARQVQILENRLERLEAQREVRLLGTGEGESETDKKT